MFNPYTPVLERTIALAEQVAKSIRGRVGLTQALDLTAFACLLC